MNIDIGPGRGGDPTLYIDNHPVAEVFDVDRMNALIQRLERYEKALQQISTFAIVGTVVHGEAMKEIAEEALKE